MKVASHNPPFLPWAGWWHKALSVDTLIYALGTKLENGGHDNRVRLGDSWLTVPLVSETRELPFKDCRFDKACLPKLAKTIRNHFGKKYPHKNRVWVVADTLEKFNESDFLADLNITLIGTVARLMSCYDYFHTVEDNVLADPEDDKTTRLTKRVRRHFLGPVQYHLGKGALDYIDAQAASEQGITLVVQQLNPGVLNQSILEIMASEDDPEAWIHRHGFWTPISHIQQSLES